jgi:hypothetical protein
VEGQFPRAWQFPISPSPQIWHAKVAILRSPILDRKADYGPLSGFSTDLVKLNSIGERRGKTSAALDDR